MTQKATAVKAYYVAYCSPSATVMKLDMCSENEVKATIGLSLCNAPTQASKKTGTMQLSKSGSGGTQDTMCNDVAAQ